MSLFTAIELDVLLAAISRPQKIIAEKGRWCLWDHWKKFTVDNFWSSVDWTVSSVATEAPKREERRRLWALAIYGKWT